MKKKIKESKYYKLTLSLLTVSFLLVISIGIILYAKGYRLEQKGITTTGQLVLKSTPDAASVFINGKFVAATNSVLNLSPGEYAVKIVKDGYMAWQKTLKIEAEVVTPTDAILFPAVPELRRFTVTGAINPTVSANGTKIAYGVVASKSYPPKNGIYVTDISDRQNLLGGGGTTFVMRDTATEFSKGNFLFSPDGKQLLVYFMNENETAPAAGEGQIDLSGITSASLLDTSKLNGDEVPDVSLTLAQILENWQKETESIKQNQQLILKKDLQKIASASMEILSFTVDESKFMYRAKDDMTFPAMIKPPLTGVSSQPEARDLKKDNLYLYDIKEDKNFEIRISKLETNSSLPRWLSTSRHYITVENDKIYVTEYDGTNKVLLFSGNFETKFVVPTVSGDRILFLISLSPDLPLNLYSLSLK